MANLTVTADSVRDATPVTGASRRYNGIAAVAITRGQAVYLNTSGKLALALATGASTAVVLGVALNNAAIGQAVEVLMDGECEGLGVSGLAYGALLKLSDTAGAIDSGGSPTVSAPMGRVLAKSDGSLTKIAVLNCSYNLNIVPA